MKFDVVEFNDALSAFSEDVTCEQTDIMILHVVAAV